MPEHSRRIGGVAAAVLLLLTGATVAHAAEFALSDERVSGSWRAGPVENGGDVERGNFTMGRYGVYFALAEHAAGADIISSADFKGNITGRLLGLGRGASFTVSDVDAAALADELDLSSHIVASGPYADGRGTFVLAIGEAHPDTIVLLEVGEFDWVLVDRSLIPDALAEEHGL